MELRGFRRAAGSGSQVGRIVVIGCGGIGARIIPALVKMVMPGTDIFAIDPDVVEQRNLVRQHFTADDVGKPKAEVMAERYHTSAVPVIPVIGRFPDETGNNLPQEGTNQRGMTLYIGGTDSKRARYRARENVHHRGGLYIDAGNEGSGGQVVLTGNLVEVDVYTSESDHGWIQNVWTAVHGHFAFPEVFDLYGDEEGNQNSCGFVFDTQTVMANQMAATIALNYIAMWLYSLPIYTLCTTFSTLNCMQSMRICSVERLVSLSTGAYTLYPEGKSPAALAAAQAAAAREAAKRANPPSGAEPSASSSPVNESAPFNLGATRVGLGTYNAYINGVTA